MPWLKNKQIIEKSLLSSHSSKIIQISFDKWTTYRFGQNIVPSTQTKYQVAGVRKIDIVSYLVE